MQMIKPSMGVWVNLRFYLSTYFSYNFFHSIKSKAMQFLIFLVNILVFMHELHLVSLTDVLRRRLKNSAKKQVPKSETKPKVTMNDAPTAKVVPDLPTVKLVPDLPTVKVIPDVPTVKVKPDVPTVKVKPDVPTVKVIPDVPLIILSKKIVCYQRRIFVWQLKRNVCILPCQ